MTMESNSQAGQDLWVAQKLPVLPGRQRTFLDIGCGDPIHWSNTVMLEQMGWRGWGIDIGSDPALWAENRPSTKFIQADATTFDYATLMGEPRVLDYLSVDIDHPSLEALRRVMECGIKFLVATIEHDAYRFGDELRAGQRELLLGAGYRIERADVYAEGYPGFPFEDWIVSPEVDGV